MSLAVRLWLSLVLLLVGAYGAYSFWRHAAVARSDAARGGEASSQSVAMNRPARPLSSFTFTERHDEKVNLGDLKGQVWVASFFFASCPGFCTQMNQIVSGIQKELVDRGVKIVSISVDPANDTPATLREYAKHFHADDKGWLFLTGPLKDAQDLGQDVFHVTVLGKEHSDRLILVDRHGEVRGTYHSREAVDMAAFKKKLDEVLAEKSPGHESAANAAVTQVESPR
ncbi:MAG TPA: SCO family protein [Pirellulales bacterium]|jgi:protein SCO1/2|nr:SCO family protein [Pirellulales bacterium]